MSGASVSPPRPSFAQVGGKGIRFAFLIAVVILVALASAFAWFEIGQKLASTSNGTDLTYSQALGPADWIAQSYAHAGFGLTAATGIALNASATLSYSDLDSFAQGMFEPYHCNITWLVRGNSSAGLPFPDFPAGLENGTAPVWFFQFALSGVGYLEVVVLNGTGLPLFELSPESCLSPSNAPSTVQGPIVDSSYVASKIWGSGGQEFVANHPETSGWFELYSGTPFHQFFWQAWYQECLPSSHPPLEAAALWIQVTQNGTVYPQGTENAGCPTLADLAV
jgi:hypothetical protein